MKDNMRYVVGGAVCGALLGAAAGWLYARLFGQSSGNSSTVPLRARPLNRGQLVQLGWSVIRVIREILELG